MSKHGAWEAASSTERDEASPHQFAVPAGDIDDFHPLEFEQDPHEPLTLFPPQRQNWLTWLANKPHPLCNAGTCVFAVLALVLAFVAATRHPPSSSRVLFSSSNGCRFPDPVSRIVEADSGAVAADEGRCSVVGRDVLKDRGTAVDAAIATALCLGVLQPMASGVGGGAFMLVRLANGTAEVIDMREEAPAAASWDMYKDNAEGAVTGGLAVAVPGELAGMYLAWQRHGGLPWARLLQPAIDFAEQGFKVHAYLAEAIAQHQSIILSTPGMAAIFAPDKKLLRQGDTCYRTELGKTLRAVAKEGPGVLYGGKLAAGLAADVQAAGGVLTEADLARYKPVIRQPLVTDTSGYTVLGAPPPSSGGAAVMAILKILAGYEMPLAATGALGLHRLVEAFKHAFAMRMNLGDPAYVTTGPVVADMLSADFAAQVRANISDTKVFPAAYYGGKWSQLNDHGTSHLSVVDSDRNAVAMTTTINTSFGSKLISPSTGILLNNQMDDFSIPGTPNSFGLHPSVANYVAPGKRPLSSMSPTIVLQGGQLRVVAGASGGPIIITTTAQVLLNYLALGQDPLSAVESPRVHHQLLPNNLFYEDRRLINTMQLKLPEATVQALQRRGHNTSAIAGGAVCQFIVHDLETPASYGVDSSLYNPFRGKLYAVSDPRKDGAPAGL